MRLLLGLAARYALVAVCSERILGYALAIPYVEGVAHLASIAVVPECRGRGLGTRLLSSLERLLARDGFLVVFLETWLSNTTARRFYEKRGYRLIAVIPGYYEWGEAALLYAKLLGSGD